MQLAAQSKHEIVLSPAGQDYLSDTCNVRLAGRTLHRQVASQATLKMCFARDVNWFAECVASDIEDVLRASSNLSGGWHLTAVSTPPPGRAPRNFFSVVSPLVQQFLLSKRFIKENLGGTETTTTTRHTDDETTHKQTGLRHTPDRLATRDLQTHVSGNRRVGGCRGSGLVVGAGLTRWLRTGDELSWVRVCVCTLLIRGV